ncbi:uncharacterized protein LOC132279697 [Cornus florida]|uniref:uncharacterized protein LOC132279697 n=1 Tax=Cornus florida TaxID=4283 RepID=UPI002897C59C|nr:uncharacterized protein LOC132279697 [Cornus florida]
MELNKNLHSLIERARTLHDKMSDKIQDDSISFCRLCSEHGRYCGITETPSEERERLITIRDSLKDVEDMLLVLQRLKLRHENDEYQALVYLEERRVILMEKVNQYRGREVDVVEELNACFGNGRSAYNWNLEMTMEKKNDRVVTKSRISSFLINCIRSLINPWNWHNTARIAMKYIVVSASISSTMNFYRSRQKYECSGTKILRVMDSTRAGKQDVLVSTALNTPLDVSCGRG